MKTQKYECPYCGAPLDSSTPNCIQICSYCGKQVSIIVGTSATVNQNIHIENHVYSEHIERIIDEAQIAKEKRLAEKPMVRAKATAQFAFFPLKIIGGILKWFIIFIIVIIIIAEISDFLFWRTIF